MVLTTLSTMPLLAAFWHYFYGIALTVTAIFLILLVLVQRGRGGGLAGAFGGMGGQSAFGTKAGDMFTKITIGVAVFWLLLCVASVRFLGTSTGPLGDLSAPDQPLIEPAPGTDGTTDLPTLPPVTEDGTSEPGMEPADGSTDASVPTSPSTSADETSAAEITDGSSLEAPAETPADTSSETPSDSSDETP